MWLMSNTSLNDAILDSIHDLLIVDVVFLKPVPELPKIPFTRIFSIIVFSSCPRFDVVIRLLVDTIVGQMHKSLLQRVWVIAVFLGGETYQSFLEQEDLQWFEAGHHYVDSEIVLESLYQMWI